MWTQKDYLDIDPKDIVKCPDCGTKIRNPNKYKEFHCPECGFWVREV